jgi:hypothetical protein
MSFSNRPRPRFAPRLTALEPRDVPATFTVTNTLASTTARLSLPWAVEQANLTPGADTINFAIPGTGPQVISITQPLVLTEQVNIDATTQPGYAGSPLVVVRGQGTQTVLFIVSAETTRGTVSDGSVVRGFALSDFHDQAVFLDPRSTRTTVADNWIGFYKDANNGFHTNAQTYLPSDTLAPAGVTVFASNNTITRNTIDFVYNGINLGDNPLLTPTGTVYSGNTISANRIGVDPTGTTGVGFGNVGDGILFGGGARNNAIGPNNVLSGNGLAGVEILHPTATGNVIFGNRVGSDDAGNAAIPNRFLGIEVANGASGNLIGGPLGGNVISGNGAAQISLGIGQLPGAAGNTVQGNIIGLNASQTAVVAAPGQQSLGVSIQSQAANNLVEANVIGGQYYPGVDLKNTSGNTIRSNFIGQSSTGTPFPNGFGVVFEAGAVNNTATGNVFGPNVGGSYFTPDPSSATGNVIDPVSPPPPSTPPPPPAALPAGKVLAVSGVSNGTASMYLQGTNQFANPPASSSAVFAGYAGDVRVATGDFNGDGFGDTVMVTGPGPKTLMAVVSGKDGTRLVEPTDPFGDANFTLGGFVTAGDIDRDGRAEWVVTPELQGGPRVIIFHLLANGTFDITSPGQPSLVANFFGIGDPAFRDGDRAALGDVNGDGILDVFSIAAFNGGPRTALYNGADVLIHRSANRDPFKLTGDFFAAPSGADEGRGGRSIAAGDVNGDGRADLIATGDNLLGTGNQIVIFNGADLAAGRAPGFGATVLAGFNVGGQTPGATVSVAATNADNDNRADLAVGSGAGQGSLVKVYHGTNLSGGAEPASTQFDPFGSGTLNGVFVG